MSGGRRRPRFSFRGEIPASKSVLIRGLLLRSYEPRVSLRGDSRCDDVIAMRGALAAIARGDREIDCGEGGLGFRLLLARVSRLGGEWRLRGSARLFDRPHRELVGALGRLGVEVSRERDAYVVRSKGWRDPGGPVAIDSSVSSQFASALLLNAWGLGFSLELDLRGEAVSEDYWKLSLEMARELGMRVQVNGARVSVPANQKLAAMEWTAESDLSSAFAVAAIAAVAGTAEILSFPIESRQADRRFVGILSEMGACVDSEGGTLRVERADALRPIEADLRSCPDLFPVLAALCAFADGRSRLYGASHLRHKESDRIESVASLLERLGRAVTRSEDGLGIVGRSTADAIPPFRISSDQDHRLVMAATLAQWAGAPVEIDGTGAVAKSFPEFLEIATPRGSS